MFPQSKLIESSDILENIFQYLSLEDQIQCVDICQSFKFVITKLLWKKIYRKLSIYKTPYISVINNIIDDYDHVEVLSWGTARALRKIQESKKALGYGKCNAFLTHIARSVHKLQVFSEYFTFQKTLGVAFRNIEMFRNLSFLSYNQLVVTNEQLMLIAENCLKLQRLEFIECTCGALESLIPGYNLDVAILASMPNLEEFVLQSELTAPLPEMSNDVLHEMLTYLRLKCLIIKNIIVIDGDADTMKIANARHVKVLNVGHISLEFYPDFKHHLRDFRNLSELTIHVLNCNTLVNTSVIELLSLNCRKLQRLSLENCDLFVEDYGILKTVQHVSLLWCSGFTATNLQQVLGSLPLKSLTLVKTRVLGVIDDIYVAPSLETVVVDTLYYTSISEAFQKSVNNMENLRTIKWLNGDINDSWIIEKCPNLRVLHIPNPYLLLRPRILKMSSLQELSFTSCKGFSWRFLVVLIQNLSIKYLNLQTTDTIDNPREIPQNACGVTTTLEKIVIPFCIYKTAQDFWMDLMQQNQELKLIFYGEHGDLLNSNFLRGLLGFSHVKEHLKSIKICGFTIDTYALEHNLEHILHQLNTNTSHFRSRNAKFSIEI